MAQSISTTTATGVLQAGRNCWRIEPARNVAFLVDGDEYFGALRAAILRARESVFILGWDIDSRTQLPAHPEEKSRLPTPLADFLNGVASSRPDLRVRVLGWDYSVLFAREREWLGSLKLNWRTHRRVEFRLDNRHPGGASHHQKIVVIDDDVAFVGGFDLARCRWDTSAHAPDDPRRRDVDGRPYGPFHDVQMLVQGRVARALGELARQRWLRATGDRVYLPAGHSGSCWPPRIAPALSEVMVAIARTEPPFEADAGASEIRALFCDAVAAARRSVFMENQYFSSAIAASALARSLDAPRGPEIVLIAPQRESGWLEQSTLGVLRARWLRHLRDTDRHGRFRSYCPTLPDAGDGCLNVHSKVTIVDDELLTVGSANLSNRSMSLDTECNLVIEAAAQGEFAQRTRAAIAALRERLLAEHLDVPPTRVAAATAEHGLIGAIESLRGGARTLAPLQPSISPDVDALVPEHALVDPEHPLDPEHLLEHFLAEEERRPAQGRVVFVALIALALSALALAWHWTPLHNYLDIPTAAHLAENLRDHPLAPLLVLGGYVLAGLLVMPVVVLIAVTGMVFGPWLGALYAVGGSLLSAAVMYGIGRAIGRDLVRRLAGPRIHRLNRLLGRRGLLAVAIMRLVPIAPFSVVNVVAGASQISLRNFLLGTLLGMTPGIVLTVAFVDSVVEALRRPSAGSIALLLLAIGLVLAATGVLRRWLGRRR